MAVLVDRMRFKGYDVGPDVLEESEFDELETDVSQNDLTTFATHDLEKDEFVRLGQGQDRGPQYTRGRVYMSLDDGSGNEPADSTQIRIVELSSQNNVTNVLWKGKYSQLSSPAGDGTERTQRIPLPEAGNKIVSEPSKIGIRGQAGGSSAYSVDLSASDVQIDAVTGER
ncbi:MAG: hypothetical protein ACI8Z7_000188 [Candidatus Nanohaloarchaea archaeon]|jgi:hypothetical protein